MKNFATIRHLWQDGSIGMVLSAQCQHWHTLRKAGFVLLSLVTLKVFLLDMAGLSGVLRALSFIGLGFSLVLLS